MSPRTPWYCHNCNHEAPTLAAARRHAKESGPIYKAGRFVTHKLTQDRAAAMTERELHL